MSYSNFQRASDLDKARLEMEEAKAELLKRAEHNAKVREERDIQAKLRGDDKWIHPSVSKKIDKIIKEDTKSSKTKKSKKPKKSKKKRKYKSPSKSEDSSEEEQKIMKKKRKKRKYSSPSNSSSSSTSEDEWIEKNEETKPLVREDWLSGVSLMAYTKDKQQKKEVRKDLDTYDPAKSNRELNPFWKDGGTGVPTFKKPIIDSDEEDFGKQARKSFTSKSGGWKKKQKEEPSRKFKARTPCSSSSCSSEGDDLPPPPPLAEPKPTPAVTKTKLAQHDFLTDQQMNELGAKLIKAEIMGNGELAEELKTKLEKAREYRNNMKSQKSMKNSKIEPENDNEVEDILLTRTTASGLSVPLSSNEPYKKPGKKEKRKGKNMETHVENERVRYFHDDDKYNLKQMFEKEKFTSGQDSDIEFAKIISKHKNPNDDLEDIFADKVRKEITEGESSRRERDEAIREHHEYQKTLENCDRCFDSNRMEKQLIIAMGKNVYLSLPSYEGLQTGHCLISPMHHVTCATQLDEDVWNEIKDFQKAVTRMFESRKLDVVFFETARNLHRKPHMIVHAIPNRDFELLPFYFKKAIQESESDWAVNKQLIDIKKDRDLRRMIPKGLPYFWVHFGTDRGFAHVIEDQNKFPENYAQEIIGGLLNLDARKWRRPRKEQNIVSKVKQFADWWKPFDIK